MSNSTYLNMSPRDKKLVWIQSVVKSPPFSSKARIQAGYLLRRLQKGEFVQMPLSKPMPSIGKKCHELRIQDENKTWRIIYYTDKEAVVILDVFAKKSQKTPKKVIDLCKQRLTNYLG